MIKGLRGTGLGSGLPDRSGRRPPTNITGEVDWLGSAFPVELINTLRLIEREHKMSMSSEQWAEVGRVGSVGRGVVGQVPTCTDNRDSVTGSAPPPQSWSLLKVNPQKQKNYLEMLGDFCPGVESYYPRYSRLGRPSGMRKTIQVERPVYPGYVFLRVLAGNMHRPVSLPVSARWVRFGNKIEVIPDYVIKRLQSLELANELVKEVRYVNPYVPGVRVRVHLPVQDILATIVKLVGHNRCIVDTPLCRVMVPVHTLQIL